MSSATRIWNSLPASLRQLDVSVKQFARQFKTHLFSVVSKYAASLGLGSGLG